MPSGSYQLGYCHACRRNVQHYRGPKSRWAQTMDVVCVFILDFGPWYCSYCDRRTNSLPWVRKRKASNSQHNDRVDGTDRVGNFIRSDGSLVLRKKRGGRYSKKFREGVVQRLLTGRTTIAQLTVELEVTEADLLAWIHDVLQARDLRIEELTGLLRSYTRAAADLIGIDDHTLRFDESENMIEGRYSRRSIDKRELAD